LPKIFELEPHVADLIAAGEVVERPASVVKELIENSFDAGAGVITVEINAGGMTFIRVTDDGCGIAPEDAKTAFLRHATSKLRGAEGLEAIDTLGFRGEALAAIAAVSRIELLTRERGADEGVLLVIEAGEVTKSSPAGCPEGTTIIVRDLFFNTPARLKFMKSDRAESSSIASAFLRCALSRPDVSARFIRDGRTEYHTPGDSRMDSCIYSLLGRDFSAGLLRAESLEESVSVVGYSSAPSAARGNRSYQFFFVNGRSIRSKILQAALEQAYANTLPSGKYPSCALYITIKPSSVDVNVHPAKTEVKFVSDKQVFDGVYYAAIGALKNSAELGTGVARAREAEDTRHQALEVRDQGAEAARGQGAKAGGFRSMGADEFRESFGRRESGSRYPGENGRGAGSAVFDGDSPEYKPLFIPQTGAEGKAPDSKPFRVIGEALKAYIIVEYRDGVWFIDKHAAHERIHFDALSTKGFEPMSQALITPVITRHGNEGASLLLENTELLGKLGFAVESFGDDAIAVRAIPAEINIDDAETTLSEICAELKRGGIAEPARRDNIFRSVACKAAIKSGSSTGARELEELAARVMSGEVSHCPHGRPVAFEIQKSILDRGFKRS
jgi:DNA mismatch repair protein MutL